MKSLVIAEKPSVASDLARTLGRIPKKGEFFENEEYVIAFARGHLVEICLPSEMEKKRGKWSFTNLPVLPQAFSLKPIEKSAPLFNQIKKLVKRKDISTIINACDAGREGELIFRHIMEMTGNKKPVRRLWLQSMTPDAIRRGFENLRSEEEMLPLGLAAQSRAESDWLVGINSTRAFTAFNSKDGGFQLTPSGRVQTPTLAILSEREEKIRIFKPRPYYEVFGDFDVEAGTYRGRWFDPQFKKGQDEEGRPERIWDRTRAQEIVERCLGKIGIIEEEKKPSSQAPPLLFDLTSLQREANGRFHLSARRTLELAQALYERHKVLTYPRTDSRYLPEDYTGNAKGVLAKFEAPDLAEFSEKALQEGWVRPNKRIFNNAQVSDHHAIIPTGVIPKSLNDFEAKIFDMVARRFIAVFYPSAQFELTTRITRVEEDAFKTEGKVIVSPGWLAVYGKQATGDNESVTAVKSGEKAQTRELEIKENETKPPPRYTEATLLSAMEGAGKFVDDEELRNAMSKRGLGTPSTRARIIEGLIADGYLVRQGRELIVTSKGLSLITLLRALGIKALISPETTGEWEYKLRRMEESEFSREQFMKEIRELTEEIVEKAKHFSGSSVEGNFMELDLPCPKCGGKGFRETYKTWQCKNCEWILWKVMAGRQLEPSEVETLLNEKRVGPLEGFRSKMGRPFAAEVKLDVVDGEPKQVFDFGNKEEEDGKEISKDHPIGTCPVCQKGTVYDIGTSYCCEHAAGSPKTCTFRMGKVILQREIPKEEVRRLLESGKTSLLPKFISRKGRPFSAYLKLENGKIVFEFEPRKAPVKKVKKA